MANSNSNPGNRKSQPPAQPSLPFKGFIMWLILLAVFISLYQFFAHGSRRSSEIPYSPDFIQLVEEKKIRECEIVMEVSGVQFIRGETDELDPDTGEPKQFKTVIVVTDDLLSWLKENNVHFEFKQQNPIFWQFVTGALPFLLVLGLLYFLFMRQMQSVGKGAMSFGKSRARLLTRDSNQVTFKDVAGMDEAKEEVLEIVEFLKDPKKYQKLGGRIPKGVLLAGAPGTGKTLLAKAIAGEAQVPFFSISGSDFVEMFVGVGASRVRDMFEQGKRNAPCIIFVDEIDAVGRSRFSGIGGGHDEREQTLNALLVQMDGFDTTEGVIILAATNRPDVLDNALLRPGRFDRQIIVDMPNLDGREEILKIHAGKVKLSEKADLRRVARGTPGFSGADLANLINEAALIAARRGAQAVELEDLEEARDKVRWGRERRSRVMDDTQKKLTAYHEAGHAIVMQLEDECDPLHKVTIIPRGQALGATLALPEKDQYTQSKRKLEQVLAGMMGGRAAEEIVFQDVTTGAQSDIKQATHIARMMVCEWGMSEKLGPQNFSDREELLFLGREVQRSFEHSNETSRTIDAEVHAIIEKAHREARSLLEQHSDSLHTIAELLLERETLEGEDVADILKHGRILDDVERETRKHDESEEPPAEAPSSPPPAARPGQNEDAPGAT